MIGERTGAGKNLEGATDQQLREICNLYHKWPPTSSVQLSFKKNYQRRNMNFFRRIVSLESEKFDLERDVQVGRCEIILSWPSTNNNSIFPTQPILELQLSAIWRWRTSTSMSWTSQWTTWKESKCCQVVKQRQELFMLWPDATICPQLCPFHSAHNSWSKALYQDQSNSKQLAKRTQLTQETNKQMGQLLHDGASHVLVVKVKDRRSTLSHVN